MHLIAMIGGYLVVSLVCVSILFIALARKTPMEDDGVTPEAPYLPAPIVVHLAVSGREELRQAEDRDFSEARYAWEIKKAIEDEFKIAIDKEIEDMTK
jgi:hypothetical protein